MSTPIGQAVEDDGPVGPVEPHEPLDVEEHEEVWAALNGLSERFDHLELHLTRASTFHVRSTALVYAVPLVQDLANRIGLDGEQMRAELELTVACMQTILSPES